MMKALDRIKAVSFVVEKNESRVGMKAKASHARPYINKSGSQANKALQLQEMLHQLHTNHNHSHTSPYFHLHLALSCPVLSCPAAAVRYACLACFVLRWV